MPISQDEKRQTIRRLIAADPLSPEDRRATSAHLADLIVMVLGYNAYRTLMGKGDKTESDGQIMFRRFFPDLETATQRFIAPLVDRDDASVLHAPYQRSLTSGQAADRAARLTAFYNVLFPWLRAHTTVFRDTFTGRASRSATLIAAAVAEDEPAARLNKLAGIPSSSNLTAPHRWVVKAAEAAGVPISPADAILADAETAGTIAGDLRDVNTALAAADPVSDVAAGLAEKKGVLTRNLEEVAANSQAPTVIMAAATAAIANQPTSRIAQKAGLNDEQTAALMAEGRVVITAGAGSGKTRVLASKVAYFVEERGYKPEQILATSFTNKSAKELKERVERLFGITDARIGTTHNIAGEIINDYAPQLRRAKDAAVRGVPDTLLKLAYEQVKLRRNAGGGGGYGGGYGRGQSYGRGQGYGGRRYAAYGPSSPYWKEPIGEWFNLGEEPVDNKGRPIGAKRIKTAVGVFQAHGKSVEQAWEENKDGNNGRTMYYAAAVYGAYEWLKKNDPQYAPCLDFNDWLSKAVDILQNDPRARDAIQRRFKVVMVDEAQDLNKCVHGNVDVVTARGNKKVRDLVEGDEILSFDAGKAVLKRVERIERSSWTRGYAIHTASGKTLTVSPNHRVYATQFDTVPEGQMALYMMYREGMGFRIGTSERPTSRTEGGSISRAGAERADCLWVLEVGEPAEILYKEQAFSLQYGIPTYIYEGDVRGCDQERINRIFAEYGKNGTRLLEAYDLFFEYPHWVNQTRTTGRFNRKVVALRAHRRDGSDYDYPRSTVNMSWTGDVGSIGDIASIYKVKNGRNMLNKQFRNYDEAASFALRVAEVANARVVEDIVVANEDCVLTTASALHAGMRIPAFDEETERVVLDSIEAVEPVTDGEFFDLMVEGTCNFFGNGILSHNTQWQLFSIIAAKADTFAAIGDDKQAIYAFRGAIPQEFISLNREKGFSLETLTMNFRSGSSIVEAANKLIAHNEDRQIPMTCRADVDRKGPGQIKAIGTPSHDASAILAASEISGELESGASPDDFGILVRNNAEADAFAIALMAKGIPFRSKSNYFSKPAVQAIISWMTIVAGGAPEDINDAVAEAHQTPGFFLNKEFAAGLARNCPRGQTYLQYLLNGGKVYVGDQEWRNGRMVDPYRRALKDLFDKYGSANTETLLRGILKIEGSKQTFLQSLIDQVDPDDIAEENETLEPTDEMIQEAALSPIKPLLDMAASFRDPAKYMEFIRKMKRANEKNRKDNESPEPAVRVDTVHQWKGLEAKHVYVSMAGNTFPSFHAEDAYAKGDEQAFDDERRLAYVAITRGQDSVTILCPAKNYMGKDAFVSRFVDEACIPLPGEGMDPEEEILKGEADNTKVATEEEDPRLFIGHALQTFLAGRSIQDDA